MSILITQADIDYAASNGLTVQINDVIIDTPTDWIDGNNLTVNIDNGVIVRIEIPSDPFGGNSVKPTIATDSRSALFDYNYYEGSLDAYEFIIELDSEQPNNKGVSDTYLVSSDDIRQIITDKYQMTIGVDDSGNTITRDLSKYMLGLIAVPFPINSEFVLTPDKPIKLGQYNTAYVGDLLKGDILSIDVGSITTPKIYSNALDYQGKTAILHLPYTDSVALDIDYVVGQTISIRYDINLYDGFTVMNIMSSKINNEVIQTLYVDLDIKVPFANVDYGQPSTGDPYNISIGGDNGVRQAYIEVLSYDAVLANGFFTVPVTDEALINTVDGYMTVDNVDLVSTATRIEKDMIISELQSGVIIKGDVTDPTDPPVNVGARVEINGIAEVGQTLTSTITDPNGVSAEVNYQWFDGTSIVGFDSTYTVKTADIGKSLKLTVTFTDDNGFDEVATSASTALVPTPRPDNTPSSVIISGTVRVGYTLSTIITDPNGVPSIVNYEWYAGTQLVGTDANYTIKDADTDKQIHVEVSFTDNDGYAETAISDKTIAVPQKVETEVVIHGTGLVGETLTVTATNSNPNSGYTITWYVDTAIATFNDAYTVKDSDVGKTITAKATFTLDDGDGEYVTSTNSIVAHRANVPSTVTITGITEVNQVLTANVTDSNGISSPIVYNWTIDGTVVSVQDTYTVREEDSTKVILLTVTFTDNDGYDEVATAQVTIDEYIPPVDSNLWIGSTDLTTFVGYRSTSTSITGDVLRATATHATDTCGIQQTSSNARTQITSGETYNLSFDVQGDSEKLIVFYMSGSSVIARIDDEIPVTTSFTTHVTTFTPTESTSNGTFRIYTTRTGVGSYFEVKNMKIEV